MAAGRGGGALALFRVYLPTRRNRLCLFVCLFHRPYLDLGSWWTRLQVQRCNSGANKGGGGGLSSTETAGKSCSSFPSSALISASLPTAAGSAWTPTSSGAS